MFAVISKQGVSLGKNLAARGTACEHVAGTGIWFGKRLESTTGALKSIVHGVEQDGELGRSR